MHVKGLVLAEVVMLVGLAVALVGGVAILAVSDRGPTDGLVGWGVGTAVLIFTSGRVAIGLLKREIRQARGGSEADLDSR